MKKTIQQMTPGEAVAAGYDATTDLYLEFITNSRQREQRYYLNLFLRSLAPGSRVLDLGCGSGVPTTIELVKNFNVIGVDISERQIALATSNCPTAKFICADILETKFHTNSLDGVLAFYSLFHIPSTKHEQIMSSIFDWLVPGGIFVGCFMSYEHESKMLMDDSMRNAPMFLSSNDPAVTEQIVKSSGFCIESAKIETDVDNTGESDSFFWVVARKIP